MGAGISERRFVRQEANPSEALAEVAEGLERRGPEVLDTLRMAVLGELAELRQVDDPELLKACRRSFAANVHAALAHLRAEVARPADAPLDVVHHAILWARRGMPSALLLRAYGLAQRAALELVVEAIEERELSSAVRREVTARATRVVLGYTVEIIAKVTAAYDTERGERHQSPEHRRVRLVQDALAGVDRGVALGYDLGMQHLGFVAWGDEPKAAVAALAEQTDRRTLVVAPDPHVAWGWFGGFEEFAHAELGSIVRQAISLDACFGFGTVHGGLEGFRATFDQARVAHRFGARADRPLTVYPEVALEALTMRDEAQARTFVRDELGALAGADPKAVALRDTLRAYFAAGGNAASCAAALRVHEQTVAYRLRRIEERLGHPVGSRRAELEVALRLEPLIDI